MSQAPGHDVERAAAAHRTEPWNCCPRTTYQKPSQVCGVGVVERRVHRRAQGQVGVDGDGGQGQDGQAAPGPGASAATGCAAPRAARRRRCPAPGAASGRGCPATARRRRPPRPASARPAASPRRSALLPARQQHQDERRQEDVQRVRVGPRREAPGDRRHREDDAGQDAQRPASRGLHDTDGEERRLRRPSAAPRAGWPGRPRCRRAAGRPRPARPAGCRSGSRWDGRCPAPARWPGTRPCPRCPRRASGWARRAAARARHEGEGQQRATCSRARRGPAQRPWRSPPQRHAPVDAPGVDGDRERHQAEADGSPPRAWRCPASRGSTAKGAKSLLKR